MHRQYARPNAAGVQRVFYCKVLVGEYCKGEESLKQPPIRKGYLRYDSTVDNPPRPEIFVAYHDAQMYPEYLVSFRLR